MRPIQIWVRTAGTIDATRKIVTAFVPEAEAALVRVGQRVRAFSPESRSRMYQARVAAVVPRRGGGADVRAALIGGSTEAASRFVLEIITESGEFLSVPNEAIVETGGQQIVYVAQGGGYAPREIAAGLQGELFTQVLGGLSAGEQVVTIGSFFIDADHRLKAAP